METQKPKPILEQIKKDWRNWKQSKNFKYEIVSTVNAMIFLCVFLLGFLFYIFLPAFNLIQTALIDGTLSPNNFQIIGLCILLSMPGAWWSLDRIQRIEKRFVLRVVHAEWQFDPE